LRKDLALANLVNDRARRVSAVLQTIQFAAPCRVQSANVHAKYRRGQFKVAFRAVLNSAIRRAYPLMRVSFSKLPAPAKQVLHGAVRRLGWTAALSMPPHLAERTPYNVLSARFAQLNPIHVYRMPETASRVTMVTDSVNAGSLYGGVETAMIFCALLAGRLNSSLRVVTRTERPDRRNLQKILAIHGVPLPPSVEFVHADVGALGHSLDIRKSDIFVSTSWWTTCAIKRSIPAEQIVQMIQEDERMFYPYGDERLLCHEALSDPSLRFIVNSRLLFEHFAAEGLETIVKNGAWFEPAFPEAGYYSEDHESGQKLNFVFYARPQHIRNLYHRGLEAIDASVATGILDPDRWDFTYVVTHLEELTLAGCVRPTLLQNLEWAEYLRLMRTADLGLALMYTPHPSYPPLDLAACGAVAATNKFGRKTSLDSYSHNIICSELNLKSLVGSLSEGSALAQDPRRRRANYRQNSMSRCWEGSLKNALDFVVGG
jgi:O-antigen biosynthesis protein